MRTIQGKVWGQTEPLFSKNNVEMHRIECTKGGYCSKHKHKHKFNAFYVESGTLEISAWKVDYRLTDVTRVSAGEMTVVPPGELHMFRALEDTVAFEIYWVELSASDIERDTVGGTVEGTQ